MDAVIVTFITLSFIVIIILVREAASRQGDIGADDEIVLNQFITSEVAATNELHPLHIGSGPAEYALTTQLKSSEQYYMETFRKFVDIMTDESAPQDAAMDYAVSAMAGIPDAISTLIKVDSLKGELGALVQNATIFSIAATCTYFIKGTPLGAGIANNLTTEAGEKPYEPGMSWGAYVAYMESAQPIASDAARQVMWTLSKRKQDNVIAVMGYLIEQGDRHLAVRREHLMKVHQLGSSGQSLESMIHQQKEEPDKHINVFNLSQDETNALIERGILVPPNQPLGQFFMPQRTADGEWSNTYTDKTGIPMVVNSGYLINRKTGVLREISDQDEFDYSSNILEDYLRELASLATKK